MLATVETRVRYAETDQMGFVYHPHYLVWCEIGRTELIRRLGTSYADVEGAGTFLAVAEAQVRYLAPARYDDVVRIATRVEQIQSRAITFAYELSRIDPAPELRLASASTRLIALDSSGRPRRLPPDLIQRFRNATTSS